MQEMKIAEFLDSMPYHMGSGKSYRELMLEAIQFGHSLSKDQVESLKKENEEKEKRISELEEKNRVLELKVHDLEGSRGYWMTQTSEETKKYFEFEAIVIEFLARAKFKFPTNDIELQWFEEGMKPELMVKLLSMIELKVIESPPKEEGEPKS